MHDSFISKRDLIHGQYYWGSCRNASIARWNAETSAFIYWREKFGSTFLEEIGHPEDDSWYDVFYPELLADHFIKEIPFMTK